MARSKVLQWLTRAKLDEAAALIYLRKEYSPLVRQLLKTELRKAQLISRMPTEKCFAEFLTQVWSHVPLEAVQSENELACLLTRVVKQYVEQLATTRVAAK
jgi:hypothetical protein